MKTNTKVILGILVGLSVIAFIVVWDLVIKERLESVDVVVVKPGVVIHKNEIIKEEDLIIEKRNRSTSIEGIVVPETMDRILGKYASQDMVGNQIVSFRYVDLEGFTPDASKGEAIRPIPNQWLYALPATLRRKDRIDVYLVLNEEDRKRKETEDQNISYVGLSPEQELSLSQSNESISKLDDKFQTDRNEIAEEKEYEIEKELLGKKEDVEIHKQKRDSWLHEKGLTEDEWQSLAKQGEIPILVDIPVMYAKDGTGNEILTNPAVKEAATKKENENDQRLTSTGTIANLELLLNEENHRMLMNYVSEGYQLYVTYN